MSYDNLDQNQQDGGKVGGYDWPDAKTADDIMHKVIEHFMKHYQIVYKKLGHARKATAQSLQDIDAVYKDLRLDKNSKEYKELSAYDTIWDEVILEFTTSGVTEAELAQIETILKSIPDTIKSYYEVLVRQDQILQQLIAEIESEEYRKALSLTREIQARRNLMTGLGPEVYDIHGQVTEKNGEETIIVYNKSGRKGKTT